MKDIIVAVLVGVGLVSISVTAHHFLTYGTTKEREMSLGVLVMVQGIITGVVLLSTRRI